MEGPVEMEAVSFDHKLVNAWVCGQPPDIQKRPAEMPHTDSGGSRP